MLCFTVLFEYMVPFKRIKIYILNVYKKNTGDIL